MHEFLSIFNSLFFASFTNDCKIHLEIINSDEAELIKFTPNFVKFQTLEVYVEGSFLSFKFILLSDIIYT